MTEEFIQQNAKMFAKAIMRIITNSSLSNNEKQKYLADIGKYELKFNDYLKELMFEKYHVELRV